MTTTLLRCRLSDCRQHAEEFSARDGRSLRAGCARALARYYARIRTPGPHHSGPTPRYDAVHGDRPVALELQVRPLVGDRGPWNPLTHVRGSAAGPGTLALHRRVTVTAAAVERWPADEWQLLWEQCLASRQWDRDLTEVARSVAGMGAT